MSEKTKKIRPIILKSISILLILLILVVLVFAILRIIPLMFSSLASVGNSIKSPFDKGLQINLNEADLKPGDIFRVSWDYNEETEDGQFNLSYTCSPDLKISIYDVAETKLDCNKKYKLNPTDNFIDLVANFDRKNAYTESSIKIDYTNSSNEVLAEDEKSFSVTNENGLPVNNLSGESQISSQEIDGGTNQNQNNTSSQPTNNTNTRPTQPALPADLSISNVRAINDTTVIFDVYNVGGTPTGNWFFQYAIPNEEIKISPLQLSLNPGSGIRYTLTFEDIESGNSTIILDPTNLIKENSETNNSSIVFVRGDGGSSSNSNNYNYNRNDEADLVIRDLEVGRMSGSRFVEDDEIDEDDDAAVRFVVVNIGGESSDRWRFEIDNIPYDDRDDNYESRNQNSLRPGESQEIIVEFENPDDGRYRIEVTVDSDDDVDEENERNNDDSEVLEVER